jgi:hypothetical protein
MCPTREAKCPLKCICLICVIITGLVVGLVMTVKLVGGANTKVELTGDQDSSFIRESNGIHLLEVNTSDQGSENPGTWSFMEWGFVGMTLVFLVNLSHWAHYCFITKRLVKKRVLKERSLELAKSTPTTETVAVVVPALT